MQNKRRNIMTCALATLLMLAFAAVTIFAQTNEQKLAIADKNFKEADALLGKRTADALQTAREKFLVAAELFNQVGEQEGRAVCLTAAGKISYQFGEKKLALDNYSKALTIFRAIEDKESEAVMLSNIGTVYSQSGEWQQGLKYFNDSLALYRAAHDKNGEAVALNDIAGVYYYLGDNQQALKYYNDSLLLRRAVKDKDGEAVTLNDIARVYLNLGDNRRALKYFNDALSLFRKVDDKIAEARALINIGRVYYASGDNQLALKYYNDALPFFHVVGDKTGEYQVLNNIGLIYADSGDAVKALKYFNDSLLLNRAVGDKSSEAATLNNLMTVWYEQNNARFATFYGKQAINVYQELRLNIGSLDKETQKTYLKSIAHSYRGLADILIGNGRISEAEEVLAMLKEEEYFDFLRRDDNVAGELKAKMSLTPAESDAFANYEKLADKITSVGAEFGELETKRNALPLAQTLAAAEQARYDELKKQLADANRVFNIFLDELKVKFGQKDVRVATVESDTQGILKRLKQPRTVIISTVVGEDRLSLIVTTANVSRAHTVNIKVADLNRLVLEFRDAAKNPSIDPRVAGKKLYDVLFPAALQKDLDNIKADTIVWSLDGTLRYAPVAALWDGKQYLVERYSTAVLTLASRDKIVESTVDRTKWLALGVGVSKQTTLTDEDGTARDFPALSAVPEELCSVVADPKKKDFCGAQSKNAGVMKGISLFDDEFTLTEFEKYLGRTPVVHIASHFSLNAGNEADSYLLLGGKQTDERKFTIARMKNETNLTGVELLTLSACNTAMTAGEKSNGVEIEGFGALAQNKGARSVLASLWSVADASTRDLMIEFYKQLETNSNTGKADALRDAQLKLLRGKIAPDESTKNQRSEIIYLNGASKQPEFKRNANAPFAHPFYWSPFILFGNWQ